MTSAEWNETVQNQYKDYVQDNRVKQERLAVQRVQMKQELEQQIKLKNDREAAARQQEHAKTLEQIAEAEQKLIKDELTTLQHHERIKQSIGMQSQYERLNSYKQAEQQRERQIAVEQRRALDEQVKLANLAEAKLQSQKREAMKLMVDEDRRAKQLQKVLLEAKDAGRTDQLLNNAQ